MGQNDVTFKGKIVTEMSLQIHIDLFKAVK